MPTPTYDLIASNVLGSNAANVTFSSIPSTYRDLVLVITARVTATTNSGWLQFNSDSGSNYNRIAMQGNGSTATTSNAANQTSLYISNTDAWSATTRAIATVQIFDYATTNKAKSGLIRADRSDGAVSAMAFRYNSTSAITSILIDTDGTYNSGSTFYLYGIVS
jgi:hypothetical protein